MWPCPQRKNIPRPVQALLNVWQLSVCRVMESPSLQPRKHNHICTFTSFSFLASHLTSHWHQSLDPFTPPAISVNWFSVPFDMDVQVAGTRIVRTIFESPPLNDFTIGEALPTSDAVPSNASDANWQVWILSAFGGNSHPIGMLTGLYCPMSTTSC